jgi:hypothetical protein
MSNAALICFIGASHGRIIPPQTACGLQHGADNPMLGNLSFPKIISARSGDAVRTKLV